MQFENTYTGLPNSCYSKVDAAPAPRPVLLAWNQELAEELGLDRLEADENQLARWFSGNECLPGSDPIALAYAGHQFGNFVPQLGDGRALLLGELRGRGGQRYDIQLKGSGPTPYSRQGDGLAALGPVIREFLVSEAMHRLGIPTTRALAAVATGQTVYRERPLPGAVLTRVAASHLRVGTFEYLATRNDKASLQALVDFAIERHHPEVAEEERPAVALFREVVQTQARLVAQWMSVGFIHGVMNTDNVTISGQTLDYGPCAFMDSFDYQQVFSSIDRMGRYAYGQQPQIQHWNMARLAEALLPLGDPLPAFEEVLSTFPDSFERAFRAEMGRKLGLAEARADDEALLNDWLQLLQDEQRDFTLSFRQLADRLEETGEPLFGEFETRWRNRVSDQGLDGSTIRANMNAANPLYIPRNHQVERAIEAAVAGDMSVFHELHEVLQAPYTEQPGREAYAAAPSPAEVVSATFCGT